MNEVYLLRVGRDSLISFAGSSYSVPARATDGRVTRAGQRVEVRVGATELTIHRLAADGPDGAPLLLAHHQRAAQRGAMVVDPAHWAELPDGHIRAVATAPPTKQPAQQGSRQTSSVETPRIQWPRCSPTDPTHWSRSRTGRWPPTTPSPA